MDQSARNTEKSVHLKDLFTKCSKPTSNKLANVVQTQKERESSNVPRNASVSMQNQNLVIQMFPSVFHAKKPKQNVVQLESASLSTSLLRLSSRAAERDSNKSGDVSPRPFVSTMSANASPRDVDGSELFLDVPTELFALGERTKRPERNASSVAKKRLSALERSANKSTEFVHSLVHGDNTENTLSASMFHSRLSRRDSAPLLF